jgi:hypothetical protein
VLDRRDALSTGATLVMRRFYINSAVDLKHYPLVVRKIGVRREGTSSRGVAIRERGRTGACEQLLQNGAKGLDGIRRLGHQGPDIEAIAAESEYLDLLRCNVVPVHREVDHEDRLV